MAEQTLIQFRADKILKQEVTEIYEALGLDLPTALRMFLVRSKAVQGMPFPVTMDREVVTHSEAVNTFAKLRSEAADVDEMTLDEINAEIAAVRAERRVNR